MNDLGAPEGIERRHIHESGGSRLQRMPIGLLGLGVLLAASVLGLFGSEARRTVAGDGIGLQVAGPERIRNGEFFEMVVTAEAERAIADLVLRIDDEIWRDVTVNTLIPAATDEGYRDGAFEFRFGPLEAGSRFIVKIDGQINPDHGPSANNGPISLGDADDVLVTVNYAMEVLP
ncbi:MAG: hypothetical protein ACRDGV_08210 [Candidatus Limnocylindria bacterium]